MLNSEDEAVLTTEASPKPTNQNREERRLKETGAHALILKYFSAEALNNRDF